MLVEAQSQLFSMLRQSVGQSTKPTVRMRRQSVGQSTKLINVTSECWWKDKANYLNATSECLSQNETNCLPFALCPHDLCVAVDRERIMCCHLLSPHQA